MIQGGGKAWKTAKDVWSMTACLEVAVCGALPPQRFGIDWKRNCDPPEISRAGNFLRLLRETVDGQKGILCILRSVDSVGARRFAASIFESCLILKYIAVRIFGAHIAAA